MIRSLDDSEGGPGSEGIHHGSKQLDPRHPVPIPLEEEVAGIRDLQRIQVGTGTWGVRMNLDSMESWSGEYLVQSGKRKVAKVRVP